MFKINWQLKSIEDGQYLTDHHNRAGECLVYCEIDWDYNNLLECFLKEEKLNEIPKKDIVSVVKEIFFQSDVEEALDYFLANIEPGDFADVVNDSYMIFLVTWEQIDD